jgi:bacterioferritin
MKGDEKAIGDYNAAIKFAQEADDGGTRELLESILSDKEAHIDWLEGQRDQITRMGIETYLGKQIE